MVKREAILLGDVLCAVDARAAVDFCKDHSCLRPHCFCATDDQIASDVHGFIEFHE